MAGVKRGRTEVKFDVDEFLASTLQLGTDMDSCVLGIDEAGRGPALGDMVYAGAYVPLRAHRAMCDTGANDSKQLTEEAREACRAKLEKVPEVVPIVVSLDANAISDAMFSRAGANLNTISHDAAISIIHQATLQSHGKLAGVFVDTVGPPESYQRKLQARFPHLHVVVAKKADSAYPCVSAASIFAKTTRDRHVKAIAGEAARREAALRAEANGRPAPSDEELAAVKRHEFGSGYPSDPNTVKWLAAHVPRVAVYDPRKYGFVRQSWGPVMLLAQKNCLPFSWAHEAATTKEDYSQLHSGGEKKYKKVPAHPNGAPQPQPPSGMVPKRDTVFAHALGVSSVLDF